MDPQDKAILAILDPRAIQAQLAVLEPRGVQGQLVETLWGRRDLSEPQGADGFGNYRSDGRHGSLWAYRCAGTDWNDWGAGDWCDG